MTNIRDRITQRKSSKSGRYKGLSNKDRWLRKILEYTLIALIIFSPLPAGSVDDWAVLMIQLLVLVMAACYVLMDRKPIPNPMLMRSLRGLKFFVAAFVILLIVQIVPWPVFLVKLFSPHVAVFKQEFSIGASGAKFMSFSVAPIYTVREGLEILTYFLLGFLVMKSVTRWHQVRRLVIALIGMGFFQAFYGLYELNQSEPRILFYKKLYNLDRVSGTFVNQNHFSGYIEMIIPLALGLILSRIELFSVPERKFREKVIKLAHKGVTLNIVVFAFAVVMGLSIILSRSRSGAFLLLLTFLLFFGMTLIYSGRLSYSRSDIRRFLQITFVLIFLLGLYAGIGATINRFAVDNLLQGGRPTYWNGVVHIISDFPLIGSGLGTFASVFPAYFTSGKTFGLLAHAHNDYLEYFSELGVVGGALLFGLLGILFVRTLLAWFQRRNPEVKGLALGGLISVFIIAVHSFTDFNLHIPANMVLFIIVLSLTVVTATYRHYGTRQ